MASSASKRLERSNGFQLGWLAILCLTLTCQAWDYGEESTWDGLGEGISLRLFVPKGAEKQSLPLLYGFHGTGGRASTRMMQDYTGGTGFVIVGAPYSIEGEGSLSREGVLKEIERIAQVREWLGREIDLAPRTYVYGFSKGGWMSDLLASEGFHTLAGALILGAGRIPDGVGRALDRPSTGTKTSELAIYIGIGQRDTNHVYSRQAVAQYQAEGHRITFEEYLARGHQPGGSDAVYLRQWLQLQAQGESEELVSLATAWWTQGVTQADSIEPPIERYLFLEWLSKAPFAPLVAKAEREVIDKMLLKARSHSALREEMEARNAYFQAWTAEESFQRSEDLEEIAASFARLSTRFPKTFFGQRAALDVDRVTKNYATLRGNRPEWSFKVHDATSAIERFEAFRDRFSN